MSPARWPRDNPLEEKLLRLDPATGDTRHGAIADLPDHLRAGDLVVVNDAATLPASLHGRTERDEAIEIRLAARHDDGSFDVVIFGAGNWRIPTEHREAPPRVEPGDRVHLGPLTARVEARSPISPRLLRIRFEADDATLWPRLYAHGRPIQYAYLERDLPLWHTQSVFAARPWAFEPASAGRPLTWPVIDALRARGVAIATLTHAAGLSSTGDEAIDAALPLPERYDIPQATFVAVDHARANGGRVIAIGTTVVRALESAARDGSRPGPHMTDLKLGPGTERRIVDGILTGMHAPTESHFALLRAFASQDALDRAWREAEARDYLCHEFGDSMLVLASP